MSSVSFQKFHGPDMSFIFDWIYSGFSSVLQFLGEFLSLVTVNEFIVPSIPPNNSRV